mmetsp:Transcript_12675/g.20781  ORF Transcript_12675/g.20781 Transcript_12675/m.20781 type:complete len:360 (+) Transcript_12675:202-1281(+)
MEEAAADSDESVKKAWEKEIKRTQSFYQEQSVNNNASTTIDDGSNNVEDVRGYGNSETSAAQSNVTVDVMEKGDDNEPAQVADEENVDVVEAEADTEDNTAEVNEEADKKEDDTENETRVEVLEEEQEEMTRGEEALQVEIVADKPSTNSGEVANVEAEEILATEEDENNNIVKVSYEVAEGEEVVAEGIAGGVEEVSVEGDIVEEHQSTADEENDGSDEVIETSLDDADGNIVAEGDTDDVANDASSESTPEQVDASSIAATDEPTSLVTKVGALFQVMLLRGRIAVSKNKGLQYLVQNKPKIKVIALASLGGVLSLLVGGHFFLAMQETDTVELPNDEWIEEEIYVEEEADEDDNDY